MSEKPSGKRDPRVDAALDVIESAFVAGAQVMMPLFSGGHDSICATVLASRHPKFMGDVFHFDTGIGAKATRIFVDEVCREFRWNLRVFKSPSTYEMFVREQGFPGPGMHQWAYIRLKERCLRQAMKGFGKDRVALITGCRSQESARRMGHVLPLKIGETNKDGKVSEKRRLWVAPCHDWSPRDQMEFMDADDLPRNPLKLSPLGMSGECFCGAFARPAEIEMLRQYAPDVAAEIDRLSVIAMESGKHSVWGTRPNKAKGIVAAQTGPMCSSCDARAISAGIITVPLGGDHAS